MLADVASRLGFPMNLLRVALAAYRAPRRMLWDGNLCSREVRASRGIVAGAAGATFELAAYTVEIMRAHANAIPQVRLSLHVDDLAQSVEAITGEVAIRTMGDSSAFLISAFREAGLPFSTKKGVIMGSSWELTQRASKQLGALVGHPVRGAKRLGYGHTVDLGYRGRHVLKGRFGKLKAPMPLLKKLRTKRTTGALPG